MTTPRKLSSRYELGEILGFGGMSEVHLARDTLLGRDVAIKVLRADLARDPTFYLRFRREAQNAAALNHPAIVAVYDTGEAETESGPLPYIVMEYVDGDTLRDIVRSKGPMPPRKAMEVIADVCAALDFSHRNGIVHRDMKPANIMISRSGAVKVMDFGIARAIADSSSPVTQTAAVIGTAQYLSPEQAQGNPVDARSDVYSLGCVLYEILTGEPPFKGDSPVAVAYQHVREDPQLPSLVHDGVPRELDSIVLKAMSKNPANRYQSAGEMRSDLIRVLGGQRPSAPTVMSDEEKTTILGAVDTSASTAPRRHRAPEPEESDEPSGSGNRWLKVALGLLVAAVVVGVVGAFLWSSGPGSKPAQVTIPDLSNKPVQEARSQLQALNFEVNIEQKSDRVVAPGNVIATRPLAGSSADERSTVNLEVSTGPEQVAVPKLSGLTQAEAAQKLNSAGLRLDPNVLEAASTQAQYQKVIDQNPSADQKVSADSTVRITIGSGPEQIRIPDVVGQLVTVARPNLEGAGFTVEVTEQPSTRPKGEVLSMTPSGGSTSEKGTRVRVTVSDGNQMKMPDLSRQTVSQALEALRAAGWSGSAAQLTQVPQLTLDPDQVGRVVAQQQPAGSDVAKTAQITVGVGALPGIPR